MTDPASATDRALPVARRGGLPRAVGARRAGLIGAGMLALTGLLFGWQSSLLDLGEVGLPGPGFFPLVLALLLVVFSVVIGIGCWRVSAQARVADEPVEFGHPPVLIALAALAAVPLILEPLGGYLTLGLLVVVLLLFIARVSLVWAVASSVLGMAACWYVFDVLLGVRLPLGPF